MDALEAVVDAQRALNAEVWAETGALSVRIRCARGRGRCLPEEER
jgi:hypothetical protein